MLKIHNLSKSYGGHTLFENVTLQMEPGERLGLVGRNGSGKSTLLQLILHEIEADDGEVSTPRNYRIGKLDQHLNFAEPTILAEACLGLPSGEEMHHYQAERILSGLGFSAADFERAPAEFSGGFQVRLSLAKVLVSKPDLLLLDEPTNYLDIVSIRWIIRFLNAWKSELILISHDRDFMDRVTTHTALIHRHQLRKIQGGTEKLYAQILQEEEIHEKTRLNEAKKRKKEEAFINRFRAQATKASAVQSRVKRLGKMPSLEKLAKLDHLDFAFRPAPFSAKRLLAAEGLSFNYDQGPTLFQNLDLTVQPGDRIAIIGKNGRGKSTLMSLLAGELQPTTGEITSHPDLKVGYFGQTNIQRLDPNMTIEEEVWSSDPSLGRTAVRNICGTMMFSGTQAEKKVTVLSGGERSRVLLGKILACPANLILLDEPTNHLDMESIEALLDSIQEFPGAVIIVTHSEMILKEIATKMVIFHHGKVQIHEASYDEFLKKIGWEEAQDPNDGSVPKKTPSESRNRKELRRARSKIIAERSRNLKPLKEEMKQLEVKITELESGLVSLDDEMLRLAQSDDSSLMEAAVKSRKQLQGEIDVKYSILDRVSSEHDEQGLVFQEQLNKLA